MAKPDAQPHPAPAEAQSALSEALSDDRRLEARAPIELKVEYKRLNTFFYDYTKNISKGGTFIRTTRPLPVGTLFLFELTVPSLGVALRLNGEVRWIVREAEAAQDEAAGGEGAGMGIRFIYDDENQRHAVERTVEDMMVASLGQRIYSRLFSLEQDQDWDES